MTTITDDDDGDDNDDDDQICMQFIRFERNSEPIRNELGQNYHKQKI